MKRILITALISSLCTMYSYGQLKQDISNLLDTLKNRGYLIAKEDVKDINDLERFIALDTKLKNKQHSVDSIFISMNDHFRYLGNTSEDKELLKKIWTYGNTAKNIKGLFIKKNGFYLENDNYLPKFLNDYEKEINVYNKHDFSVYLEATVDELKRAKNKYIQDSIRVNKEKSDIASLPTKEIIKTKFRTYTHKTGHVLEMFPVGFTAKGGKAVIDRVFGRKAMYREVDGNGMNTIKIEFYDSGSIMNVTVYGGKGGGYIYYAQYRDHANKPYEIQTYSADGKFHVVLKRIYDISEDKTNIITKYQYVPMDYWYD